VQYTAKELKEAKKAEGQTQAEWGEATRQAQGGPKGPQQERRQGGEATIPTGASAIRKAPPGMGGGRCVWRGCYCSGHKRWFRGVQLTG